MVFAVGKFELDRRRPAKAGRRRFYNLTKSVIPSFRLYRHTSVILRPASFAGRRTYAVRWRLHGSFALLRMTMLSK